MSRGRHARPSRASRAVSAGVSVTTTTLAASAVAAVATAGGHASAAHVLPASPVKAAKTTVLTTAPVKAVLDSYSRPAVAVNITVASGDTLSGIAQQQYDNASCWPGIYDANKAVIGGDPNVIEIGQELSVPASCDDDAPQEAAPAPVPAPSESESTDSQSYSSGSDADTSSQDSYQSSGSVSTGGMSSYEQCVISHESGGNAAAVNSSSGAGGLFQFLPSTWESLGYSGLPQDAPVSEQEQAFSTLYAESGSSPWETDGCG